MVNGAFSFETCLLKHHVRKNAWLPACKERLRKVREIDTSRQKRRLRYFTFCAVGAIDVLMLDIARIIRQSSNRRFDTVYFFDRTEENVLETQKRIPGARGFPGDFVKTVLLEDAEEDNLLTGLNILQPPEENPDHFDTRQAQRQLSIRREFIKSFPFDVINLDLEEFLFKPNDPMPGDVIRAFRKIIDWQKRGFTTPQNGTTQYINGFSLMFTTQIGPPNISPAYLDMLQNCLIENLESNREMLYPPFLDRTGGVDNIQILRDEQFDLFFKLAMPKILAETLIEHDWYVDPEKGIRIFEFERPSSSGPYKMLHLVMDVVRQNPPEHLRGPRFQLPQVITNAHTEVVRQLFQNRETVLSEAVIDQVDLQADLDLIFARREKYLNGEY